MFISEETQLSQSQQDSVVLSDWRVPQGKVSLPRSLGKHVHHFIVSVSRGEGGGREGGLVLKGCLGLVYHVTLKS